MIIKKFLANTEKDAIEMAKKELGGNAVVMNIKKVHPRGLARLFVRSKVEVTAALDDNVSYSEPKKTEDSARESSFDVLAGQMPVPPMPKQEDEEQSIQEKLKKLEMLRSEERRVRV